MLDCSIERVEDELLGEALKATIVINKGSEGTLIAEFLKQHCAKHLAMHKIPHIYEFKDQITISATGKKIKK